jgi:quinohemoprotein ethanol dehydrogenase
VLPALPAVRPAVLDPPPDAATAATAIAGKALYHRYCSSCHGDSATGSGVLPDLRYSGLIKSPEAFDMTVRQGARVDQGMVAFKDEISPQDLERIRAYVIHRANEDKKAAATTTISLPPRYRRAAPAPRRRARDADSAALHDNRARGLEIDRRS